MGLLTDCSTVPVFPASFARFASQPGLEVILSGDSGQANLMACSLGDKLGFEATSEIPENFNSFSRERPFQNVFLSEIPEKS
jgi:hypothetical protein